ncbi:MAG: hypothetical protein ACXVAW_17085 [Vulcanimicrobiaceae bacterium]
MSIFRGHVRWRDRSIALTARELELFAALGLRADPLMSAALAALMWPDKDDLDAANSLHATLSRIQRKTP